MKVFLAFTAVFVLGYMSLGGGFAERAEARFGALAAGDLGALVGAYAPGAEAFFFGTPRAGFLRAEEISSAWEALLEGLPPVEPGVEALLEIPGVNTVVAALSLGDGLRAIWALAFDPEGGIVGEDLLIYGLPGLPQPPYSDGEIAAGEYPRRVEAAGVEFSFRNGTLLLFGALRSPGTGWVAVGFDPEQRMRGANIVFAWVDGSGATVEDHYGSGPTSHGRDEHPHVFLAAGAEAEGETIVEFVIPLASGDPEDKDLQRKRSYTVILAYHRSHDGFRYHTARGRAEITLD
jgi:hypothetical protein